MPKDATAVAGFELGTSSMEVRSLHTVRLDRSATTAPQGLGNEDNVHFPRALLILPEDSNRGPMR